MFELVEQFDHKIVEMSCGRWLCGNITFGVGGGLRQVLNNGVGHTPNVSQQGGILTFEIL